MHTLHSDVADWHAGGKGPDPVQAKLDREMEEYQKGRSAAVSDNAEDTPAMESTEEAVEVTE